MRVVTVTILVMLTSLSGCFGDEIFLEEDRGIPGGLTLACLRSSEFTSMNLHVLYEEGYQPEAMELLKQRLDEVCDKPGGINIITEKVDFSHGDTWSADDVRTKRWNIGSDAMSSETLTWYFLFPSGMYEDESVLGVAVDASTVAIFLDSIEDAEGFLGRPSSSEIERSVTVHESGHLLGLVNTVYTSDVDHEDPDHPHHSNNEDSVMYWAVETNTIGSFFSNDIPDEFDNDDKMDLEKMADGTYSTTNQVWG